MITLYGSKPQFGLPQSSPFATKVEVLLKMAGLPYQVKTADLRQAPKGKMPWIQDQGQTIADSRLIRHHLETQHGADFSGGYSARDQAAGLMLERTLENHVYWFVLEERWLQPENFNKGPAHFFDRMPAVLRPLIKAAVLRKVRRDVATEGLLRLSPEEKRLLMNQVLKALVDFLDGRDFALGAKPSGTDATLYAFLAGLEAPVFTSPYGDRVRQEPVLMAYLARMKARFFPNL